LSLQKGQDFSCPNILFEIIYFECSIALIIVTCVYAFHIYFSIVNFVRQSLFQYPYILYNASRYDIKGRQFLKTLGKYYFVDSGIRNHIISRSAKDLGHILENIVYLELLRRKNRVNIGKLAEKEVDFVATNASGIEYFQVALSVLDEKTLERELAPLQEIKDNYPKYILTLDDIGKGSNYEGIRQLNVIDWLLD